MENAMLPGEKRMHLRYAGACRVGEVALPARTEAIYEPSTKTVRCLDPDESRVGVATVEEPINAGTPGTGGSARSTPGWGGAHPRLSDEAQSTRAWDTGALGEERVGSRLNELASNSLRVCTTGRFLEAGANIDHLAATPTGVFVIDAEKYAGRPHLKIEGGLLRPRVEKLLVGSHDCTKLVDRMLKQIDTVRGAVGYQVAVQGGICFVEADWPSSFEDPVSGPPARVLSLLTEAVRSCLYWQGNSRPVIVSGTGLSFYPTQCARGVWRYRPPGRARRRTGLRRRARLINGDHVMGASYRFPHTGWTPMVRGDGGFR